HWRRAIGDAIRFCEAISVSPCLRVELVPCPPYSSSTHIMTSRRRPLVTRAHAKVNLDLRVLGTRSDGFHELRTVFQAIELHDTLTWTARTGPFTVKCRLPGVPLDESNLVSQAASRLWKALGRSGQPRDIVVNIEKRIPLQAGLGGGSADAAAALLALARLWGGAPITLLREVGTSIGADVSFFLSGG